MIKQDLWDEMTHFQEKMDGCSLEGAPLGARAQHAVRMCNGLFMEVAELQDSFSWKNSRDVQRKEEPWVDKGNVAREIVDCIFFLHHVAQCFSIRPVDLEATFTEVMANNRRRHIDGDLEEPSIADEPEIKAQLATINAQLNQLINGEHDDNKEL